MSNNRQNNNKFEILYEDQEIILINKPCGMAVQGGANVAHSVDSELPLQTGYKIHLVHRLDKDTAGILIVAKNPQSASKWIKLIGTNQVTKEYTAVCFGLPSAGGKKDGKKIRKGVLKDKISVDGRLLDAVTHFEIIKNTDVQLPASENSTEIQKINLSVAHLTLETGRKHQIRIQMAKAGCPLAGDDLHGDFKKNKLVRKLGIKKLCLCASRLTIPVNGELKAFEIQLPAHMKPFCED